MIPEPSISDLRFDTAMRHARAPATSGPKRARRTPDERIADLQTRVEELKSRAATRRSKAARREPGKRTVVKPTRVVRDAAQDPFDAELRELVDGFVKALHTLVRRNALARAKAVLEEGRPS